MNFLKSLNLIFIDVYLNTETDGNLAPPLSHTHPNGTVYVLCDFNNHIQINAFFSAIGLFACIVILFYIFFLSCCYYHWHSGTLTLDPPPFLYDTILFSERYRATQIII